MFETDRNQSELARPRDHAGGRRHGRRGPLIERGREAFPDLRACSFDKGFHSQKNRRRLDAMLELNVLPKKGRLSAAEKSRERDQAFAEARRKHSGNGKS